METRWTKEYKIFSDKLGFLSKLAAFLITTFSLLSIYDLLKFFREYPEYLNELIETAGLIPSSLFQLSIGIIFALRFALLFFKKENFFWAGQATWLIGILVLFSYWIYSRPTTTDTEVSFRLYSMYPEPLLANGSHIFGILAVDYLFLSVSLELIILVLSIIKSK